VELFIEFLLYQEQLKTNNLKEDIQQIGLSEEPVDLKENK
jgi:hypothetical protein